MQPKLYIAGQTQTLEYLLADFFRKKDYSRIIVLCDSHTEKHCLPLLNEIISEKKVISLPAGEESKTLEKLQTLWTQLLNLRTDREGLLINLGGGVICDIGAFAAGTYKRGIDFIHLPTSLLAMVDAAHGGKCGVNFLGLKNQLGLFNPARAIFVEPQFLSTLAEEELVNGYAEMAKHALIADKVFWGELKKLPSMQIPSSSILQKAISIKNDMVVHDFTDKGVRKKLNFGHTMAMPWRHCSMISKGKFPTARR